MPVRNEEAFIRQSLGAVLAQDYPAERLEVIVADGLSTDGTREIVRSLQSVYQNLKLIDNPGRIVSTGFNLALREAGGDLLVLIGGHCVIAADYVSQCVSHLANHKCDCVGGVLETVGETFSARAIAAVMSSRFGVGGSTFRVGVKETAFTDTAVFAAYKREIVEVTGEFDEELVRNQDDEYNYRLRKLGGSIMVSPAIRSRYYSRATLPTLWKQYFQYGYWKVRILQKHPRQMRPRQFVPALFVIALILLGLAAFFGAASKIILLATLFVYLVANLGASAFAAKRVGWRFWPLISIAFTVIHFAYGSGFLIGLVRFWNRWEMPGSAGLPKPSRETLSP
jgi:glycosyltransferase involved in cell wall biosynthesis